MSFTVVLAVMVGMLAFGLWMTAGERAVVRPVAAERSERRGCLWWAVALIVYPLLAIMALYMFVM